MGLISPARCARPSKSLTTSHCRAFVVLSVSRFRTDVLHLDTLVLPNIRAGFRASTNPARLLGRDLYRKLRIAEGVDQGFYPVAFFTEGAVVAVVGGISRDIIRTEEGVNCHAGIPFLEGENHFINSAEQTGDSLEDTAVIIHTFSPSTHTDTCGYGSHQEDDVLVFYPGDHIVPEKHLTAGDIFRLDDIDGLMSVHGKEAGFHQLLGQKCADYLGAVQADDGVHDGIMHILLSQGVGSLLCFGHPGLGKCHINIIVDVGMVGGKMTGYGPDRCYTCVSSGIKFHNTGFI